jgi:hypothetical protein
LRIVGVVGIETCAAAQHFFDLSTEESNDVFYIVYFSVPLL